MSETANKPNVAYSEDEQQLATNAHNFFKQNQFDSALGLLKKLNKTHSNDVCLLHNRALTEFCKSGKTKSIEFRRTLSKLQKALQQSHKDDEDLVIKGEKANHATLHYNQALLLFNIHQYSEAEIILEKLLQNLDVSDEKFHLSVVLLLVECYLINCNTVKAENCIKQIQTTYIEPNEESTKKSSEDKTQGQALGELSPNQLESLRNYIPQLKACCYLKQRSIKACKREIKVLTTTTSSNQQQTPNVPNITTVFLKSNFEYVRCNYHKAYKLLGSSPNMGERQQNISAMLDNNLAVIYSSMGKYHLGNFYMEKSLKENESWLNTSLKQHNNNNGGGNKANSFPISILHMNKRYELLYNRGIQLLHGGDPTSAFDCFITTASVYHTNPRLWLRLAECCIHKYTNQHESEDSPKRKTPTRCFNKVGSSVHRKVVVCSNPSHAGRTSNTTSATPTMEFAFICLSNALIIMEREMKHGGCLQKTHNEVKILEEKLSDVTIACLPSPPVVGTRICYLYASILCNSAFVALHLGNASVALQHAACVLNLPKIYGSHRYLANMYAGEALVVLDRISEAIQHLQVDKITNVSCAVAESGKRSPLSDDGSNKSGNGNDETRICKPSICLIDNPKHPYPPNTATAHAHMMLNLAACHCLRSENEKSIKLLQQAANLIPGKSPNQGLMLAVYLNLSSGNINKAVQILQHNDPLLKFDQPLSDRPGSMASHGDNHVTGVTHVASVTHKPGSMTPDRVVKAGKSDGKNKRNRR
uniref:CCR4-NOT transcription complex subunit 10 isoform X1 n=1 Tax=Ciona intestinalis TaxID=7719 RepID=UPI0000522F67|nr:CCR4-NOT transcription complex subunit 10 isoform X1 [Ciona intestinalis]|eukprot:XP_002131645.1 CCR4-NOT transcription complex subunit 10 isoform X1 [Ciona intestinalis]